MNVEARLISPLRSMSLAPGEVQVWHFILDVDADNEAALGRVLDDEERHRAERFRFVEHRRRFVVRRGLLRLVLSQYAGTRPETLRFARTAIDKPALAWPDGNTLKFSASSSGRLGAVAVACDRELGLDLEQIRPNGDHDLIASSEFSPEENDWLRRLPEAKRRIAFYQLWTCKEAYLKGKGVGLTVPLNDFAISLSQETPRLVWSNLDNSDVERWSLQPQSIEPGFVACLAMEGECRAVQSKRWSL